jgi:hypothetical protein
MTILSFLSGFNNGINILIIISLISLLNRGKNYLLYVQFSVAQGARKHLVLRLIQTVAIPLFPTYTLKVCIGTKFNCVVTGKRDIFYVLSIHGVITSEIQ